MYPCMWTCAKPVFLLFMSSTMGIVFNPIAGAITDHSPSAKDVHPYFRLQFYVEELGHHRKPVLILPNGLINPENERTAEINSCRGWDSNPATSWSTMQHLTAELSPLTFTVAIPTHAENDVHSFSRYDVFKKVKFANLTLNLKAKVVDDFGRNLSTCINVFAKFTLLDSAFCSWWHFMTNVRTDNLR